MYFQTYATNALAFQNQKSSHQRDCNPPTWDYNPPTWNSQYFVEEMTVNNIFTTKKHLYTLYHTLYLVLYALKKKTKEKKVNSIKKTIIHHLSPGVYIVLSNLKSFPSHPIFNLKSFPNLNTLNQAMLQHFCKVNLWPFTFQGHQNQVLQM